LWYTPISFRDHLEVRDYILPVVCLSGRTGEIWRMRKQGTRTLHASKKSNDTSLPEKVSIWSCGKSEKIRILCEISSVSNRNGGGVLESIEWYRSGGKMEGIS
jgi:hypothetical protein